VWIVAGKALKWIVANKELVIIGAIVLIIVGALFYISHLRRELAVKESQISVLNSRLEDQKVVEGIKGLLKENDVWQSTIKEKLDSIAKVNQYIHELNIEHADDMDKILSSDTFKSLTGDRPEHRTVFDVCEPPCNCICE
jgi:hypothetical protein